MEASRRHPKDEYSQNELKTLPDLLRGTADSISTSVWRRSSWGVAAEVLDVKDSAKYMSRARVEPVVQKRLPVYDWDEEFANEPKVDKDAASKQLPVYDWDEEFANEPKVDKDDASKRNRKGAILWASAGFNAKRVKLNEA